MPALQALEALRGRLVYLSPSELLDDVLTATDSGRLARVMAVLEEAAERLQVLILTCHPERYRGLRQGRFFDFETLVREREGG